MGRGALHPIYHLLRTTYHVTPRGDCMRLYRHVATGWRRPAPAGAPEDRHARAAVDVLGTASFALTVVGLLSALTLLGDDPALVRSPLLWLLFAANGVALVLFVLQE